MPSRTYTHFSGQVVSQNDAGTERALMSDVLGSVLGLSDPTQAVTDSFSYWTGGPV